jgi:hypothetical protein
LEVKVTCQPLSSHTIQPSFNDGKLQEVRP